jgi:hypothetical protein
MGLGKIGRLPALVSRIKDTKADDKLWKQLIDLKYNTCRPNIFYRSTSGAS